MQCHVLGLCAYLKSRHDHDSKPTSCGDGPRRAGAPLLWTSGPSEARLPSLGPGCSTSIPGHSQETTSGPAGQRQGQGGQRQRKSQGQGKRTPAEHHTTGVGLQRWFRGLPEQSVDTGAKPTSTGGGNKVGDKQSSPLRQPGETGVDGEQGSKVDTAGPEAGTAAGECSPGHGAVLVCTERGYRSTTSESPTVEMLPLGGLWQAETESSPPSRPG